MCTVPHSHYIHAPSSKSLSSDVSHLTVTQPVPSSTLPPVTTVTTAILPPTDPCTKVTCGNEGVCVVDAGNALCRWGHFIIEACRLHNTMVWNSIIHTEFYFALFRSVLLSALITTAWFFPFIILHQLCRYKWFPLFPQNAQSYPLHIHTAQQAKLVV